MPKADYKALINDLHPLMDHGDEFPEVPKDFISDNIIPTSCQSLSDYR